jgi:hypothetical protein
MPALSSTDKAAIGFMDHAMGESPSSDDLRGMSGAIDDYADRAGVDSDQLRSSLQKMLPTTSQHPDYQVDSASGAVSGASGQKVYGEQHRVRISKKQLRRIIREAGGSRSAGEVFRTILDRAVEVAKERRMGAPELNDGGFDALINQAFKELNPPEFASREDLDAQHDREVASAQAQVRGQRENRVTERRIRQIIRRVTRRR